MNMKRKKTSVKKAAKYAAKKTEPRKFSKKVAKPAEDSSERKTVKTAAVAGKAAGLPPAAIPAGTASYATIDTAGAAPAALLAVPDESAGPATAAAEGAAPEPRVRDDERIARLAGSDIVPLSHRRYAALWAFQPTDALAAANSATSEPSVAGTTRIVVKTDAGDAIELSTFRNPSGLLVVRTRSMESPIDTTIAVKPRLVPRVGEPIDPAKVKELRVENVLYETRTFDRAALADGKIDGKIMDASTVPPVNDPKGSKYAMLLGRAPISRKFNGAQVTITEPTGVGATAQVDDNQRFVLHASPSQLFPSETSATSNLKLEIKVRPPANEKLALTYRITRDNSDEASPLNGANNTARTKLIGLVHHDGSPSIAPKDVPAIHLLLM